MSLSWSTASFNYYMISFLLKYFPGDIYLNGLMSSASEITAYAVGGILYQKIGVKKGFFISFGIATLGGFGMIIFERFTHFFSDNPVKGPVWIFPSLVLLSKFGTAAAFNINFVSNIDLFPVLFSTTALGFCNFAGCVFTVLAP